MVELYIVRPVTEDSHRGIFGTVAHPDGRVWILHGRSIAEAADGVDPVERRMTQADVVELLRIGAIDQECADRQAVRVMP